MTQQFVNGFFTGVITMWACIVGVGVTCNDASLGAKWAINLWIAAATAAFIWYMGFSK